MKISIITVCYNSVITLENTIQSVINQSYHNIEYIIIDGSSSDGTLDVIKKYKDQISKWISESDEGLYDAMNKGVSMATGEIIGILNSDDVFNSKTVIEEVVRFHEINNIDASIGDVIQINKRGMPLRVIRSFNWNPLKILNGMMPPHPSLFLKKEIFEKYGMYNIGFKIGADYELIIRLFLINKINWKYSGITTTRMLIGGVSTSGISSYFIITNEIKKGLMINNLTYSNFRINLRFLNKFMEYIRK